MIRCFRPILLLVLLLSLTSGQLTTLAQDEASSETDVIAADATPDDGGEVVVESTGTLRIVAYTCADAAVAGVTLIPGNEFFPQGNCYQDYAGVLIDGIDYGPAAPILELQLPVGVHGVTELSTGYYLEIEVVTDGLSTVSVVTSLSPEPTPAPSPTPVVEAAAVTVPVRIVYHDCDPDIQTTDAFFARGSALSRSIDCPVMTRPGEAQPAGSVTAGQEWFDFLVTDASGNQMALGDGQFVPGQICESETGASLTTNPYDDGCLGRSGYQFDLEAGPVSVIQTAYPLSTRFGYAEMTPTGNDWLIQGIDRFSGTLSLDLTYAPAEGVELHLYAFRPAEVTVVTHLCAPGVTGSDLEAAGGFVPRQTLCPADAASFGVSFTDGAGSVYGLESAVVETALACEFDMGIEFTAPIDDDACLSAPGYQFFDPVIGWSWIAFVPGAENQTLGFVDTVPGSGDAAAIGSVDLETGVIGFDTSVDGGLVLHLYAVEGAVPTATPTKPAPTATAIPTATATPTPNLPGPAGSGTVQVAALYCLSNRTLTSVTALPPGQLATAADLSGDCFAGDSQVTVALADGGSLGPLRLGADGIETITGLAANGSGRYRLTESLSGQSAAFDVAAGAVTRVIIRFEVALSGGEQVPGQTTGGSSTGGGATGGSGNPLDLLGGLVTDELGGVANEGILYGSSSDPQFFIADLLGDLDAEEIAAISGAEALPAVGTTSTDRASDHGVWLLGFGAAMLALMSGWVLSGSRRQIVPGTR